MYICKWIHILRCSYGIFTVFRVLTDFVCLYTYEFWLSLCKIVRSSVILLLPLMYIFCYSTITFKLGVYSLCILDWLTERGVIVSVLVCGRSCSIMADLHQIMLFWSNGVTCLHADCCFSELELSVLTEYKAHIIISSSKCKLFLTWHNRKKLLIWLKAKITHSRLIL